MMRMADLWAVLVAVKAVSYSRHRQDKTGMRGVGFDLATQLTNIDMQIMRLSTIAGSPYLGKQHLAGHDLATVLNKRFQQVIFSRGQLDLLSVDLYQALGEINSERPSYKSRLCSCFHLS